VAGEPWEPSSLTLLQADELAKLDKWLAKTEERLDGGKIIKPESIVDACQALSKARELRALFEKKEKPLITAKVIHHMLSMCHVATRS